MNCSRLESLLSDYMDGLLQEPVLQAFEAHLNQCASCQELLDEVAALRAQLEDFPVASPPDDLAQRILLCTSGIPRQRSFWRDLVLPTLSPFMTQRFAFATGIMFVFLSLMVNLLGPGFSTLSASDLSPSAIAESGARIVGQISGRWEQFKDARAGFVEELSLWAEDLTGRLDYHLITGLFKSYQESLQEQEEKVRQTQEDRQAPPQSGESEAPQESNPQRN